MLKHYLKIALRNLWKYKTQSIISIIGLAVGFTCFALATLWIRYEMTFDSFHKNAKQMYVVYLPAPLNPIGYDRNTLYPLANYLKETFPEIADAIPLQPAYRGSKITVGGAEYSALTIQADSSFFRMFDVKILEGSKDFLIPSSRNIAITREKARQLFGNEHPVGKKIKLGEEFTICAVVSGMPKRSNYAFDFIMSFGSWEVSKQDWNIISAENTIIELRPGTDVKAFEKKLYNHEIKKDGIVIKKMTIKSITKLRYTDPNIERDVKFQHIVIFAISGILVILCSLFNYLTLFVSRFRIRQKELALRMVCGASEGSLFAMLSVEFMLTLSFAVLLGCMLTQWLYKPFLALSDIQMSLSAIYRELLMYIAGIILISFLAFWLILFIFRSKSLNASIRQSNKNLSRKISVIAQLVISIVFAFCTIVILKQMYFLHHTDELGFSFKNRGSITTLSGNSDVLANQLKQISEITETVDAAYMEALLPSNVQASLIDVSWDDKPAGAENINLEVMQVSPEYTSFYNFRLVAGEMLTDADPDSFVLINESAVKSFGWHDPVGKHFGGRTVKGVIKNIYNFAPTIPAKPAFYFRPPPKSENPDGFIVYYGSDVLFKYKEGMWKSCKEKIEQMKDKYSFAGVCNAEEEYNHFLKSENTLIKLLSLVSAICVLICVFGLQPILK